MQSIVDVLGQHDGLIAWRTACAAANQRWPGVSDDVEVLIQVLSKMAAQPGLIQVVARSNIIRLHPWNVLARSSKNTRGKA